MPERWFKIEGEAEGDRTLEEQMIGLAPALAECKGKRILDLGCAEGLIAREFSRAGARIVHGIEKLQRHVDLANKLCHGLPMTFACADLELLAAEEMKRGRAQRFDIVLALAILHKLPEPGVGVQYCAWSARNLVVIRLPEYGITARGILRNKKYDAGCHLASTMKQQGFALEKALPGPRKEQVQYWRRKA